MAKLLRACVVVDNFAAAFAMQPSSVVEHGTYYPTMNDIFGLAENVSLSEHTLTLFVATLTVRFCGSLIRPEQKSKLTKRPSTH